MGLLLVALAIVIAWYIHRIPMLPEQYRAPEDVVKIERIEMWPDAVSMLEDKLRFRFHFHNIGEREIETITVHFTIGSLRGETLIDDRFIVTTLLSPGDKSSWCTGYWHSEYAQISLEDWELLTHKNITDFYSQATILAVSFMDGGRLCSREASELEIPRLPDATGSGCDTLPPVPGSVN